MEFPKGYAQERTEYRTHEAERKLYAFLKDYFTSAFSKVVSSVRYYLFGKETIHSNDLFQFATSLQVSAHASNSTISLLRTEGSGSAPTATTTAIMGSVRGVGYDGTSYAGGCSVWFRASQTWTGSAHGSYLTFVTTPNGSTTIQESGHILPSGSWASGMPSLATNATTGFLYIPTCAGVPTGVPESVSGRIPLVADTSGGKVYAYLGGWTALN